MQTSTSWHRSMRFWLAFGIIGLLSICGYAVFLHGPKLPDGPQEVRLKPDSTNQQMTEVVLFDVVSRTEKKLFTLSNVYRDHYHPVEFVRGNIYIVKRLGEPGASWTDELWSYSPTGKGRRIYSEPGLDFRVSSEAQRIVIFSSGTERKLVITDLEGAVTAKMGFSQKDLSGLPEEDVLSPLFWHEQVLWFGAFEGLSMIRIFSLDAAVASITAYDLLGLGVTRQDSALEPVSRLLVYSDYHPQLDTEDPARQTATLFVYNLVNQKKIPLVSANVTRAFEPKWIDGATVEYTDPAGSGRVQMHLPSF